MIELSPGDRINDLEIVSILGEGGMGSVYLAKERGLERFVAVKLLHPSLVGDEAQRARFKREASVLSKLRHKNLVTLYRYGLWKNQFPYLAMEYVVGQSLQDLLQQQKVFPPSKAIAIVSSICDAVHYAHSHGVVHRDLKPANVMLAGDEIDELKIIDFGLAKTAEPTQSLTQSGTLLGSYYYMSPEQCAGNKADRRSDLYALGCILYELVSGKPPFSAPSVIGLLRKHCSEAPPPLVCDTEVPIGLERVVSRLLRKAPADRYQTAIELQADLMLVASGQGGQLRVGTPSATSTPRQRLLTCLLWSLLCVTVGVSFLYFSGHSAVRPISSRAIRPKSIRADLYRLYRDYFVDCSSDQVESSLSQCAQTLCRISKDDVPLLVQGYELYGLLCKKRMYIESDAINPWSVKGLDAFRYALGLVETKKLLAESVIRRNIAELHEARGEHAEGYCELEKALSLAIEREPSANFSLDPNLPGTASREEKASMMAQLSILSAKAGKFALAENWLRRCTIESNRIREPNRSLEAVSEVCISLFNRGRAESARRIFADAECRLAKCLRNGEIREKEAASTYASLSSVPILTSDLRSCIRLLKLSLGCLSSTDDITNFNNVNRALQQAEASALELHDKQAGLELAGLRKRFQSLELRRAK